MDSYEQYARDAEVLGRIGKALVPQDTHLQVRLPEDLAGLAVAAWQREDSDRLDAETPAQRIVRHRAANLDLIGLCIQNTGQPDGDDVSCELDAWYIGAALEAADDQQPN